MQDWYVCVPGGAIVGPVTTSLLIRGIRTGKVPHDALVCRPNESTWRALADAPELAAALPGPEEFRAADVAGRYTVRGALGEGGMGEVHLCGDDWIGREVAMKVIRKPESRLDLRARFVREARLQGQLEHPSIVPVYDLGTRSDGAAFFTMKRVRGLTLAAIIHGLRNGDREITAAYSRRRLLTALSRVCLAVAFAHSRGIVHRDLKPDNVMIGDFGEVYVLDWGLARVLEDSWAGPSSPLASETPIGRTQLGEVVGTPGYAAPEQMRGEASAVGTRSDIYALGAILFEVLALQPLHAGNTVKELVTSTLAPRDARPSRCAPDLEIAPELDEVCVRATAFEPADRYATARDLEQALERHLNGERDAELRRDLARSHADVAAREIELAAEDSPQAEAHRARALQELGAALALDPTNRAAMHAMLRVLLDAPAELPAHAEAELRKVDRSDRARIARTAAFVYGALLFMSPLMLAMQIRRPFYVILFGALHAAVIAYNWWMWKTSNAEPRYMQWALVMSFALIAMMSALFGPFVLVPGAAAVNAAALIVGIRANRTTRRAILAAGLATIFVPALLQASGLAPSSYAVEPGSIRILSNLVEFRPLPAMALLALGSAMTLIASVYAVGGAVESLTRAERRNFAQAWRLRQMLPSPIAGSDPSAA
jgi:serine/threonine-protein kinase